MKKILSLVLVLAMVLSLFPGTVLAAGSNSLQTVSADLEAEMRETLRCADSKIYSEDFTAPETDHPDEIVRVIVEMRAAPAMQVASTSAGVQAMNAETAALKSQEAAISAARQKLGLEPVHRSGYLVNTVSYDIRRGDMEKLKNLPGVVSVTESAQYKIGVFSAKEMTHAYEAWQMGETGYTGKGMAIAIIDSGVNYLHQDMVQNPETMKFTQAEMKEKIANLGYGQWFTDKVPFGYSYANGTEEILSASQPHGYHVAGIAAANGDETQSRVSGVAPDAQIFAMQVYDSETGSGGFSDDIICAIEDSVKLGADVINLSLGTDGGFYEDDRYIANAVNAARDQGVFVSAAAGNAGIASDGNSNDSFLVNSWNLSDTAIISEPATADGAVAVASVNSKSTLVYGIHVRFSETEDYTMQCLNLESASMNFPDGVTFYDAGSGQGDFTKGDPGGKVAVIAFDGTAYSMETAAYYAAYVYGCAGAIFYCNDSSYGDALMTAAYSRDYSFVGNTIPVAFVSYNSGMILKNACEQNKRAVITGYLGPMFATLDTDTTASHFSSWGVTPSLELKPEVAAPGGGIYSLGSGENGYLFMSGTSMATPFLSGSAAVVKQYLLESGMQVDSVPEFIRMDLMNTASPVWDTAGGSIYSVRQMGAGMVDLQAAVSNQVLVTHNGKAAVELGDELGAATTGELVLHNYGTTPVTYRLSATDVFTDYTDPQSYLYSDVVLDDAAVTFSAQSVTVPAGGEAKASFTLNLGSIRDGHFAEGYLLLTSADEAVPSLSLPFLGFMGDWDDEPIVDAPEWEDNNIIKEIEVGYYGAAGHGTSLASTSANGSTVILGEVYYEDTYGCSYIDPDDIAFSPNGDGECDFVFPWLGMVRNAKQVHTEILDAQGNVIADLGTVTNLHRLLANDSYTHGIPLQAGISSIGWDGTVYSQETGTYTVAPEGDYIVRVSSRIREDGEWQSITMPLAIDTTKPEITYLEAVSNNNGKVTVTFSAQDLHGLSNDVVFNINGVTDAWGLAKLTYNEENDTYSMTLSQRDIPLDGGIHVALMVMDRAGNTAVKQVMAREGNGQDAGFLNLNVGGTTYVLAARYPYTYQVFGYAPEGSTATVNGKEAVFTGTEFMAEIVLTQAVSVVEVSIRDAEGRNLVSGTTRMAVDVENPALGALLPDGDFDATAVSNGYTLVLDEDQPAGTAIPLKIKITDQSNVTVQYTDYSNYQTRYLTQDDAGYVHFNVVLTQAGDDIYGQFRIFTTDAAGHYIGLEASVWTPTSAKAQEAAGNVDLTPNLKPIISNLGTINTVTKEGLQEDGSFRVYGSLYNPVERVTVNGAEAVIDKETLTWYCDIILEPGMNTIIATSYRGKMMGHSGLTKLIYSESGPSLHLDLPEEQNGKYHVDTPEFTLQGTVTTVLDDALVFVNDALIDDYNDFGHSMSQDATQRQFSYPLTLKHGDNFVTVMARDTTGAATTVMINLQYCPKDHLTVINAREATCTEDGYTGDTCCAVCGELLEKGEIIPAASHRCNSKDFADLDLNRWYHAYTDYVLANGLMKGMDKDIFAPNATLNRGMLVTTLYRLAGEPEVTGKSTFCDVPDGRYFSEAVAWAQANGIVKGMTEDTFCPANAVTREQAATFLYRYVTEYRKQAPAKGADLSQYTDAGQCSPFARTAMAWATAEGFLQGYGDGTAGPQNTTTRAQMAKFLTILDQNFSLV